MKSLDKEEKESIEIAGIEMNGFTIARGPGLERLKQQFAHTKDKEFYIAASVEHQVHMMVIACEV